MEPEIEKHPDLLVIEKVTRLNAITAIEQGGVNKLIERFVNQDALMEGVANLLVSICVAEGLNPRLPKDAYIINIIKTAMVQGFTIGAAYMSEKIDPSGPLPEFSMDIVKDRIAEILKEAGNGA